jgi:RNA recognition motif-containing protein
MSNNRLYVGNLSWSTSNESLRDAFSSSGKVVEAKVMTERETGRSRGFGFVTYSTEQEANAAVEVMNATTLDGRQIKVAIAEERQGGRPNFTSGNEGRFQSVPSSTY